MGIDEVLALMPIKWPENTFLLKTRYFENPEAKIFWLLFPLSKQENFLFVMESFTNFSLKTVYNFFENINKWFEEI